MLTISAAFQHHLKSMACLIIDDHLCYYFEVSTAQGSACALTALYARHALFSGF